MEGVQRRATKLSRDLRNEPYIRLTTLCLPTLQFRRDRADILQVFRILNGYEDIDSSRFFPLSSTGLFLFQYSAGPFEDISLKMFKDIWCMRVSRTREHKHFNNSLTGQVSEEVMDAKYLGVLIQYSAGSF